MRRYQQLSQQAMYADAKKGADEIEAELKRSNPSR